MVISGVGVSGHEFLTWIPLRNGLIYWAQMLLKIKGYIGNTTSDLQKYIYNSPNVTFRRPLVAEIK